MNRNDHQVAALRNEIAHTRAELGETVQELAARADVPARARASARRAAQRARVATSSPGPIVALAAGAAAVVALVLWSRRDRDAGRGQAATWRRGQAATWARRRGEPDWWNRLGGRPARRRMRRGWRLGGRSRRQTGMLRGSWR